MGKRICKIYLKDGNVHVEFNDGSKLVYSEVDNFDFNWNVGDEIVMRLNKVTYGDSVTYDLKLDKNHIEE